MSSVWLIEYKKPNFRGWQLWLDPTICMWMYTEESRNNHLSRLRREEKHLQFRPAEYQKVEGEHNR